MFRGKNKTFDFFISCYGEIGNLQNITLNIGKYQFFVNNIVNAIEDLFIIVTVLCKSFPIASIPVWQFISQVCFSVPVPNLVQSVINFSIVVARPIQDTSREKKRRSHDSVNRRQYNKRGTNGRRGGARLSN